jgi:DNA repair exonuclease SbcCD nuclease subunit
VGLIHGSVAIPGKTERDDVVITTDEIAASGLDYLALGHWHSAQSGRAGQTTWAYPGAPEPVAVDQDGAGEVCLVRLADGVEGPSSVKGERVREGRTVFRRMQLDAGSLASQEDLIARIEESADPDLVLAVEVVGIAPDQLEIVPEEVERRLAPAFLHLRVSDRSVGDLGGGPTLPEDTVAGRFIADLEARIREADAAADAAAAEDARAVLRLGRRMLLEDPDHVTLA